MRPCELRWLVSFSSSCLHAADAVVRGWPLVDPRLADALGPTARDLRDEIAAAGIPAARFWRHLTALAHQFENNRQLAMLALRKTIGGGLQQQSLAPRVAGRLDELEHAFRQLFPRVVDEVTLRAGPIREAWETCGPGLMRRIGGLTDARLIVENADVVLVQPVLGGGGQAHLLNNSVRLEAVLTNNIPRLPEVLRLAWLVGQLHHDLPMFSERIHADRLPQVAGLAMLPVALQAASEFELAACDMATLVQALASWRLSTDAEGTAGSLTLWWQTFQTTETPWSIALAALDQMLGGAVSDGGTT